MKTGRQGNSTTILLADDHVIMRQGLAALVENDLKMKVVGHANTGKQAIELCEQVKPDIVLMDITMPDMNGIEASRAILKKLPFTKIIALSMHSDKRFIAGMLNIGASGYLLKHSAVDELEQAISTVLSGKIFLSSELADTIMGEYIKEENALVKAELTTREREILQLIAEGNSTREIAAMLSISIATVETHRANIMEKLGMYSVAELTKFAIREGLTSLE